MKNRYNVSFKLEPKRSSNPIHKAPCTGLQQKFAKIVENASASVEGRRFGQFYLIQQKYISSTDYHHYLINLILKVSWKKHRSCRLYD